MTGIDLVIPMVFPSDPAWQAAYNKAMGGGGAERNVRYRSWQTEELLVRCCLKFMPWLRCIHILLASESQADPLLSSPVMGRENWKIVNGRYEYSLPDGRVRVGLVFHRDFIPAQYLPTFNVNTIEMWLHRIPDLSEYFIYSNDDFFPLSPLQPEDFFQQRVGASLLPCQHMYEKPYPTSPNIFHKFVKNGLDMVAADWGARFGKTWLRTGHSMQPMLRSTVEHVCTKHADRILQSFTLKREPKNFNQYIFPFWQHLSGQYIDHVPPRRYVGPKVATRDVADILRDPNAGIVCLNDNEGICDWEERAAIVRREIAAKVKSENTTKTGVDARKCSPSPHEPIEVLIIHYNTPELTAATIQSLWKHTPNARVTVFDNSDSRPFSVGQGFALTNIEVIDNTKGQIVNWDSWLATFPNKMPCPENKYGSAMHCYSVEMCYDRFPNGFFLMDSDVLLKQDITPLCDRSKAFVGRIHCNTRQFGIHINRLCPWLCWINTPLLKRHGVRFFNKEKMWKLHPLPAGGYDTGAWFLEAALGTGLPYSDIEIMDYIEHFRAASWRKPNGHIEWLEKHKELWRPTPGPSLYGGEKYTVLTCIFGDYERVHEVGEKDPTADYILVTDNPKLRSRTWRVVLDPMDGMTPFEKVCEVRYNLWRYAEAELVVRLDGSIGINRSLRPIIEKMEYGGYDRCLMIHPSRNTMPREYEAWVRLRGYSRQQADRCLDYMQKTGYPMDHRGLFQTCFEVVRRGALNNDVNSRTLSLLRELAEDGHMERVDQTILSFVLNHYYADRINVLAVPQRIVTDGRLMMWYQHNSDRPNPTRERIAPKMFNKPVSFTI